MTKRIIDITISLAAFFILLPIFLVIAVLIKLDTPGPVFYRGVRVGKNGKPFKIFKFRTMVASAEKLGGPSTPIGDSRVTASGRFIRKYNIDELPQFINVLKGEMSIIGPRPEVLQYAPLFTDEEKIIFTVKPGISDLATVWVGNEGKILEASKDPEKDYLEKIRPTKIKLQLEYVKRQSVLLDFRIMLTTLKVHLLNRLTNNCRIGTYVKSV